MPVSCSPRTYQFVIVAFLTFFGSQKMALFCILNSSWSGTWLSYYQLLCYQFIFTILQVSEGSIVSYFAGYSYGRHMLLLCLFVIFWGSCWPDFRLNLVWLPVLVRYVDVMMMITWASWGIDAFIFFFGVKMLLKFLFFRFFEIATLEIEPENQVKSCVLEGFRCSTFVQSCYFFDFFL